MRERAVVLGTTVGAGVLSIKFWSKELRMPRPIKARTEMTSRMPESALPLFTARQVRRQGARVIISSFSHRKVSTKARSLNHFRLGVSFDTRASAMACAKPASLIDLSSSTTSIPLCARPSLMT